MLKFIKLNPYPIEFAITTSGDDLAKYQKKIKVYIQGLGEGHDGVTFYYNGGTTLIILLPEKFKRKPIYDQINILAHEVAHCVLHVWEFTEERNIAHEANAYLTGFLMEHCWEYLYPPKKKVKKKNVVQDKASENTSSSVDGE
jgi:hypothetical protein